jgi:hypothetical protein
MVCRFRRASFSALANVAVGGRNVNESALLVGVDGISAAGEFEVLVDDTPMAKVAAGHKTTFVHATLSPIQRPISASFSDIGSL